MVDATSDDGIVIGRVVKPHGIRGEVVITSQSDVEGRFAPGVSLQVGAATMVVEGSRPHAGRLLVAFEGIADRNAAEGLRGATIVASAANVGDSDVYYAHELVGMDVVTEDARWLGVVADVIELPATAGYDLLEVDRDGQVWLLPSDDELVEVGEDDTGTDVLVVVDPPAGLLPDDQDDAVEVPASGEPGDGA